MTPVPSAIGAIALPLNMEMAATEEMVALALKHRPHAACIVPERREEVTTEGGLDAFGQHNHLQPLISRLSDAGIRVSRQLIEQGALGAVADALVEAVTPRERVPGATVAKTT